MKFTDIGLKEFDVGSGLEVFVNVQFPDGSSIQHRLQDLIFNDSLRALLQLAYSDSPVK